MDQNTNDGEKGQGLFNPKDGATPENQQTKKPEPKEKPVPAQVNGGKKVGIDALQSGKFSEVQTFLSTYQPRLSQIMPKNLMPEVNRQLGIAAHLIATNENIRKCHPSSIAQVVMRVAMTGLDLGLGHVYLIPYGGQLQYQLGYKGMLNMAYNSGRIAKVQAFAVYEGEEFYYGVKNGDEILNHTPDLEKYGSTVVAAYAIVSMKDGAKLMAVIGRKQIESLRLRNASQSRGVNGAWATDYDQMAKAKVIKQALKMAQLSVAAQTLLDGEEVDIEPSDFTEYEVV